MKRKLQNGKEHSHQLASPISKLLLRQRVRLCFLWSHSQSLKRAIANLTETRCSSNLRRTNGRDVVKVSPTCKAHREETISLTTTAAKVSRGSKMLGREIAPKRRHSLTECVKRRTTAARVHRELQCDSRRVYDGAAPLLLDSSCGVAEDRGSEALSDSHQTGPVHLHNQIIHQDPGGGGETDKLRLCRSSFRSIICPPAPTQATPR